MTSVHFAIYRPGATPDDEEIEIQGEAIGLICAPEPDVGIMTPSVEDVFFRSYDGIDYELTDVERERVAVALFEAAADEGYCDWED